MGKKKIGTDQFAEFVSAVVRSLPRDMEPDLAQFWIRHQDLLATTLDGALIVRQQPAKAAEPALPTEITVGGRVYEILSFLREGEKSVPGDVMVSRAKELGANLGQEDCEFILAHQADIPAALRNKVIFVFPDLRRPDVRENVAYLYWVDDGWYRLWNWLSDDWFGNARLLRRK
jgi:hypothetical protein